MEKEREALEALEAAEAAFKKLGQPMPLFDRLEGR